MTEAPKSEFPEIRLLNHPRAAEKGVARALLQRAEVHASSNGISRLYSEVSLTARPFFEKNLQV
jgi:putative acetyltransferase